MVVVAHISDLHFGRTDPRAVDSLRVDLKRLDPRLVVISGDLTQRAYTQEFLAARAFLRSLQLPVLAVPGNHDIPLWDVTRRFLAPLGRYRRFIRHDLEPRYEDEEIVVIGVNTARALSLTEGRINQVQMARIGQRLANVPVGKLRVVVAHHPFLPPPHRRDERLVGRAARALASLESARVDVVLGGHQHSAYSDPAHLHHEQVQRSIVIIQAGTAVSTRLRGETNAYNVVRLSPAGLDIEVRELQGAAFRPRSHRGFVRGGSGWRERASTDSSI